MTRAPSEARSTSPREIAFQRANSTFERRTPLAHTMSANRPLKLTTIRTASAAAKAAVWSRRDVVQLQKNANTPNGRTAPQISLSPPMQVKNGTQRSQDIAAPASSHAEHAR